MAVMRPAFQSRARRSIRAVSVTDSSIGAMPGGQGWPGDPGSGAPPGQNRSSASLAVFRRAAAAVSAVAAGAAGRVMAPVIAARTAAALSWARAVRAVCRQIAAKVWAWDWSQPRVSFPVLNVSSIGHR
jgi:hypothetical protein